MQTLDGSLGEGGGQVLRTSLSLALCTGQPFCITRIRARRKQPGLMRQHLAAVDAARTISGAQVTGAALHSTDLMFHPGPVRGGDYTFAVGTAGSATLVLQTVLPALVLAAQPSTLALEGGTHNPQAPPFEFLVRAFLPLLRSMGPQVTAVLERHGFYPKGGGRFVVSITPVPKLEPLELLERGVVHGVSARAIVAALPNHIGERELKIVGRALSLDPARLRLERVAGGPGNVLLVSVQSERLIEVFAGFGERALRAEQLAERVVAEVQAYLEAEVPVGPHLADQLLLPLALAGRGAFCTLPLTGHARTQIDVIDRFLGVRARTEDLSRHAVRVEVGP